MEIATIPIFEYTEDGSVRRNVFSFPSLEKNLWRNSITTIQRIIDELYVRKNMDKDVPFLKIINRSDFSDFENAIENENVFDSLSLNIKDSIEQFKLINDFFSFNKTEWAKIFSVSRVTVYDWLNRKTIPNDENANKISNIYKLLGTIPGKDIPISRTYLHQNIEKYNMSLLEIFSSNQDIIREYQDLNKTLVAMSNQSRKNNDRLVKLSKAKLPKDEILDYNLKILNY
ncbi:MAG: hypothetical protein JJE21_08670 [Spirochaetaceae bacterium]|nr:hypothetical protein [Spirochaetaceae bacterium]